MHIKNNDGFGVTVHGAQEKSKLGLEGPRMGTKIVLKGLKRWDKWKKVGSWGAKVGQ